ncbi:MAG: hypothetical protein JAZ17_01880 [Candidatus Thiodiazotropha endolucinida]|nr:hypothetical protein [Candidatus Thiodiazotropha endolucinida]
MLEKTEKAFKFIALVFMIFTTGFWLWICTGSWQDKIRQDIPRQGNGCAEFDSKMPIGGHIYSPDPEVITKYSGGYFLLN